MVRKSYNKIRPLTELEDIKQSFPLFDSTPLELEASISGEIIKLTTENIALQAIMRTKGFIET